MINKFSHTVLLFFLLVVFCGSAKAQTIRTNLDIFFDLLKQESRALENKGEKLKVIAENPEFIALANFANNLKASRSAGDTISAVIDTAFTVYPEIHRDGFFGEYFFTRKIMLRLNYGENTRTLSFADTLAADKQSEIENSALPFTRGELPAEPFWESIVEPVVFIVTATAVVFALFFGRS